MRKYIHVCLCITMTLLYTRNQHNIVINYNFEKDRWLTEIALEINMSTGLINSLSN